MRQKQCLLVQTKDKRKFLTYKKNLPLLVEFTKTFGAEIYLVNTKDEDVLEIDKLALAICDPFQVSNPNCKIIKSVILKKTHKSREEVLKDASKIRNFIRRRLLSGKTISLKDLKIKYINFDISDTCLCNHLSSMRQELTDLGYTVEKLGAGKYCLE